MNLSKITNPITSKIGRQILVGRKHSPTILFGAGVAGVVATTVLACRATLKLEEVLEKHQEDLVKAQTMEHSSYSEMDRKKDIATIRVRAAVDVGRLYGPAVIVGIASVCALTGSQVILNRRNAGLTAAYAILDKGFKEYRARVSEELGEDKDREFYYGMVDKEVVVDTDEGPVTKTVKVMDTAKLPEGYVVCFDQTNKNWSRAPFENQMFLSSQKNYANDRLKVKGYVLLNDVLESLGFERTKAGCVVGWVKDGKGDGFIDFGVFENEFMGRQFVNGEEKSIWLKFNVDGVIYDHI